MATIKNNNDIKKIGLLGGSFNPAHNGHKEISKSALETLGLDEIWWLVTPQNPQKIDKLVAPIDIRINYANNLIKDEKIKIIDVETEINSTFTIDVIKHLSNLYRNYKFIWLMGADNFANFSTWHKWQEISQVMHIAVFSRPDFEHNALQGKASCVMKAWKFNSNDIKKFINSPLPQWAYIGNTNASESATKYRNENGEQWWLKD